MIVSRIVLEHYRNYNQQVFDFLPEGSLLIGPNGVGKTNLLEALLYFSIGRSIHLYQDQDLIEHGFNYFKIAALALVNKQKLIYDILYQSESLTKKQIQINHSPIKKTSELLNYLIINYLSPNDIHIVDGSPRIRRHFFDMIVSQYFPAYLQVLRHYNHIVYQRNALLKQGTNNELKDILDEQFISISVDILQYRLRYLQLYTPILKNTYQIISANQEVLSIDYQSRNHIFDTDNLALSLKKAIEKIAKKESLLQRTLVGPHLDDIQFMINQYPANRFASQGQKRSISIAVKLAHPNLMMQNMDTHPIIILDDILGNLDPNRIDKVFKVIPDRSQLFIASPDLSVQKWSTLPILLLERKS